jgi:dTDP-4-amino-4,6-dideoxygalactose transaminase
MPALFENSQITLPSDQEASGRTLADEELALLKQVIASGTLNSTKGSFVKAFESDFAEQLGVRFALACSSGSAAVHAAIAAIDPTPGDEIITSPITDMGALSPIVYQGAIPRFAEVDVRTCNVTASSIEACLSDRTKAIIVTHLFGNPCEMGEIMELANAHKIPVIEDCAQAFKATYEDRTVGTIGLISCFSLQQGKHITTGEGGIVVTDDQDLARRAFLFINKAWGYGDPEPDHYFLALNYRMTELQGAVALAQLPKLAGSVANRIEMAARLTAKLKGLKGIEPPYVAPNSVHTYWKYCVQVDGSVISGGAVAMGQFLKERGIASAPRYIQKPAFMCEVFQKQRTFGRSNYPFNLAREEALDYDRSRFAQTFAALERILVLPWNEKYSKEHVDYIAEMLALGAKELGR